MKRYILAITGASGVLVGFRVLEELTKNFDVTLIVSEASLKVIRLETNFEFKDFEDFKNQFYTQNLKIYHESQIDAPPASGSYKTDGMFIVPCSIKTLSKIAYGFADNLITRTADVAIKENRRLIIAPREMPLSAIHLENMLKLAKLGVVITPLTLSFYHKPKTIEDLINFVVGKILDCMGIENDLYKRWGQ
ncbi:MAG: UbiX family flavin prenyltransferase [Thermodesulfovibrio sp.]|nr:UbiX family flavin prenyltransferase [Thermodesulfovibrio sp.]